MSRTHDSAANAHRSYITIEDAAQRLGVAPVTIRRWISGGTLPAYRFGTRLLRVALEDIDAMAEPVPHAGMVADSTTRRSTSFRYNTRG